MLSIADVEKELTNTLTYARGLVSKLETLGIEIQKLKQNQPAKERTYEPDLTTIKSNPGQGVVMWWNGWDEALLLSGIARGIRLFQIDWNPGTAANADFRMLNNAATLAAKHGVQLAIRPGYIWPPVGDLKVYPDQPLSLVKNHIRQLVQWLQTWRFVVAYVMVGFWGKWAEGHTSSEAKNSAYWVAILQECFDLFPPGLHVLLRRPDMLVAAGFDTPAKASAKGWGVKQMGFNHANWDAGTDNAGVFAGKGAEGRAYRLGLEYVPSAVEVMEAEGGNPALQAKTYSQLKEELQLVQVTAYHEWGPGRFEFEKLGGLKHVQLFAGARFNLEYAKIHRESVVPGEIVPVTLTIKNDGDGWWYQPHAPAINVQDYRAVWWSALSGLDLGSIEPHTSKTFDCTWLVSRNIPAGEYVCYLTLYPTSEARKQSPQKDRYKIVFANLKQDGGEGGNNLEIKVKVV